MNIPSRSRDLTIPSRRLLLFRAPLLKAGALLFRAAHATAVRAILGQLSRARRESPLDYLTGPDTGPDTAVDTGRVGSPPDGGRLALVAAAVNGPALLALADLVNNGR